MAEQFTLQVGSISEAIGTSPPDATLIQMGRLIFRLGHFESFLTVLVRGWLPEEGRPTLRAMAKKPISQKFSLARAHSHAVGDSTLRQTFLEVLETAERAYQVRHDILHGAWQVDPVAKRQVAVNFAKPDGEERLIVDVDKAAQDADAALRGLLNVMLKSVGLDEDIEMLPFYSKKPPWFRD